METTSDLSEITVGELIDRLSAYDRDAVAWLAINPFFPMAHRIAGVVAAQDEKGRPVVFIADDGEQIGYLPPDTAVELTWQQPVDGPPRRRRGVARSSDDT